MFKLIEIDEDSPSRAKSPYTPFSPSIDVSESTLERLNALYRAGHLPDSPGLRNMAEGLGWMDCVELDTAIALNVFIEVRMPGGRSMSGHQVACTLDTANPQSSQVGNVVIPARRDIYDWWVR